MGNEQAEIVVAGHICLDIIPLIGARDGGLGSLLTPGKLIDVGPATIATGGAVSNTGLALRRLGVPVRLMGKVGADLIGRAVIEELRHDFPDLADGMIIAEREASSYTVVISPPGVDRAFLHCPGCNDTFGADDIPYRQLAGARLFHFGYPPLMRRMYGDGGGELAAMFSRVKQLGLTTSLDMARPDPVSPAGRADWIALLERVLPFADVFLPSLEEILFMLDRTRYDALWREAKGGDMIALTDLGLLRELSGRMLGLGVALAAIKLGDQGLYLRTTDDPARLAAMGKCAPPDAATWLGRELLTGCFQVELVGATGSGDCTIAGFLTGLLRGMSPEEAVTLAVAVGACNVEAADATSAIPPLEAVQRRIAAGWKRRASRLAGQGMTVVG